MNTSETKNFMKLLSDEPRRGEIRRYKVQIEDAPGVMVTMGWIAVYLVGDERIRGVGKKTFAVYPMGLAPNRHGLPSLESAKGYLRELFCGRK